MKRFSLIFGLLVTAAVLFNNWLLAILLNRHLLFTGGSISEFSATSQPHHIVFRILDIAAGLLLVGAFSLWLVRSRGQKHEAWLAICGLILGIGNCIDALLPLPCSGTVDKICNSPVRINVHRVSLPNHAISSTIIGLCFVLLPLAGLYLARALANKRLSWFARAALITSFLFFGLLAAESFYENSLLDHLAGFAQQIQMLVFGCFLIAAGRVPKLANPRHIDN